MRSFRLHRIGAPLGECVGKPLGRVDGWGLGTEKGQKKGSGAIVSGSIVAVCDEGGKSIGRGICWGVASPEFLPMQGAAAANVAWLAQGSGERLGIHDLGAHR